MTRAATMLASIAAALATACGRPSLAEREAMALTGGEPRRGRTLARSYGCGSCHRIPGVAGATGTVGPPLESVAVRSYLAGRLPNTPANLIRWVQHPHAIDPHTAMPELGMTDADARDVAAYLETLR